MAQPDYVIGRCLCIDGVPEDVQVDEILANFTGILDVHNPRSGKLVVLFNSEQAARLQLQKTPEVILKHGRTPNVGLKVNVCDVSDIKASWLYHSQPMEDQESVYANTAISEESIYQNVAHLRADNGQTYDRNHGINPNQKQNPMDTSVNPPPPDPGQYVPGWGQYPNTSQGYFGQPGYQQPGPGQSTYANQDGNQQNPLVTNPSQLPHGPWYATGFPPSFPPGMVFPIPGGMQCGKDQQELLQFNPWGLMAQAYGGQMPYAPNTGQGSSYPNQQVPWYSPNFVPQHPEQLQYGSPPTHEIGAVSHSEHQTEVKSAESNARSDDSLENALLPKQVVKEQIQEEPIRKIKVTKLPEGTTEDTLKNFFENRRRNGGGPIENIEYHPATSSAIIEFQEAEAVERVLQKVPFLLLKKQISVEEYVEVVEDIDNGEVEPSCRTIEVCGFAENTKEEVLEMYFENTKRSGGDDVTSVVIEDGVAFVTFKDEKVVPRVLEQNHTVDGQQLSVALHLPKKRPAVMEVEEEEKPVCTVEVRGYKIGSQSTLELYFENEKRSGGGEISKFDLAADIDRVLFITFASEEVARRVAGRNHKVADCTLDVKLYAPPKHKSVKKISRTNSKEPEESVPHCTIEVRGVTSSIVGTLQLYFENKRRSGGEDIVKFEHKEENEIAYITYESEEVAKRVVSHGQHKVEGQPLEVNLYIPPPPRPTYDDRVLLTGLSNKVTQDGLTNFLEARADLTPVRFLFGEDRVRVIITFQEFIDFVKLEEACKKRPLEGSYLQPSKVHISNCIIIINLKIITSDDTISLYFENERRSGGGPVENVKFNREEEFCLVFFKDHTVCDRVMQRRHKIDGSDLQVSIYYECLGRISDDGSGPSFKTPKPVKLEGLEYAKMQFVMKSEPNRTALEKQLQDCYTQIQWPQSETDCTTLSCTLTSDVQDCKKKALTWAKQAEQNLHDFLKVIFVHEHKVFQEIFDTVLQSLQNLVISNPDGVTVFVKKAELSIQVVGHKSVAVVVVKDIEDIIKKAEAEFDRKRKQTKDTLTSLKHHQLKFLLAQKYPSQMEQKCNGLKVKINLNTNEIVFEGLMQDISNAKVAMYETVQNAAVSKLNNLPNGCLHLYKSKEVKDYIVSKLKSKKLVGVWEVEGSNLNIYADSDEAVVKSCHIIKESVIEHQRDLGVNQKPLMQSQKWQDKTKDLEKKYQGKFNVVLTQDLSKLFLYFTADISGEVIEEVNDFLSKHSIFEKAITCRSGSMQLIEKQSKDKLDSIAKDLQNYFVEIIIQPNQGFLVRGNQDGINQATFRLKKLIDGVEHREHELRKPGIAKYMESKGQGHINTVESQTTCVIQIRGQEQYGLRKNEEVTNSFDVDKDEMSGQVSQAEFKLHSGEKICTVLGDITELNADVLVNAADPKLEHRGGLAKAIVDKGGRAIREECRKHIEKNGPLSEGEIYVTSAGNLQAKIVIHAVSPVWKGGHNNEEETLREIIWKCLETTAKKGYKSVAVPALGAGIYACPVKLSTRVIAQTVRDFFQNEQGSAISIIYLFDIKPQTVKCFTEALENSIGKQLISDEKQKRTPRQRNIRASQLPGAIAVLPRLPVNTVSAESSSFGSISIKVVKGEMASQKVDIIVNTVDKSLDLTHGAVSQSLLRQGGQNLQDECKKKYPNGIKEGDIAVTKGGNLTCKMVYHGVLAHWSDTSKSKQMLHGLMDKCLDQCENDGLTSIAFPALGTGNLSYPKDLVAKEMFQHISNYSRNNPSSSVTEVRFVVFHKDFPTIKAFESEQQKCTSGGARLGIQTTQQSLQEEDKRNVESGAEPMDVDESPGSVNSFPFGKIIVKIDEGDITQNDADCIVNSSNEDLDLTKGAVAKAIAQKGGKALVDEAKKNANNMKKKGYAVTKGHGMNCKHVIHIVAPDNRQWKPVIEKCLKEAEKLQAKSVAFPAVGTSLGVSAAEIAGVMFKTITDFQASQPKSLKEVRIVIFQAQMVRAFIEAAQNWDRGAKPKEIMSKSYCTNRGESIRHDPRSERASHLKNAATHIDSTVWIDVFAFKKVDLDSAIQRLKQLIEKDFYQCSFTESIIKKFSLDQISRLRKLAQEWEVQLVEDLSIGDIKLDGVREGVMKVSDSVHNLIREAERKEQEKKSAEMLKLIVQWYFIEITTDSSDLKEYPSNINLLLENAYKDQKPSVTFSANDGVQYKIDFGKMEEFPVDDASNTVTVVRKDLISEKGAFELPGTWSAMGTNENLKVVSLQATDQEYKDVQKAFLQSVGNRTVIKVERIQNKTLYQQYEAKKKLIEQNNPGHPNENLLWHGTSVDTVDSINMHGFNRSYCGKNAVVLGNGVYFAVHATYSASDTYSKPDPSGNKKMYRCRVLTGKYTLGAGGMRVPPPKSAQNPNDLFDSVVDNVQTPSMYIIFNDTQAYPDYLITFK